METRLEATKLMEGISDAEFQYVLGVFTELKAIGKELHANIMQERRDFYDGISTAETKDDSEARELQWENDAKQQANIIYGRAVERGVSENILNLIDFAITQYIWYLPPKKYNESKLIHIYEIASVLFYKTEAIIIEETDPIQHGNEVCSQHINARTDVLRTVRRMVGVGDVGGDIWTFLQYNPP